MESTILVIHDSKVLRVLRIGSVDLLGASVPGDRPLRFLTVYLCLCEFYHINIFDHQAHHRYIDDVDGDHPASRIRSRRMNGSTGTPRDATRTDLSDRVLTLSNFTVCARTCPHRHPSGSPGILYIYIHCEPRPPRSRSRVVRVRSPRGLSSWEFPLHTRQRVHVANAKEYIEYIWCAIGAHGDRFVAKRPACASGSAYMVSLLVLPPQGRVRAASHAALAASSGESAVDSGEEHAASPSLASTSASLVTFSAS